MTETKDSTRFWRRYRAYRWSRIIPLAAVCIGASQFFEQGNFFIGTTFLVVTMALLWDSDIKWDELRSDQKMLDALGPEARSLCENAKAPVG